MSSKTIQVPNPIYTYINKYYKGAFLSDITAETDEARNRFYNVSAGLDDAIYHLTFNSYGSLVHRTVEPLIEMKDEGFDISD